jgi:hypothetical protein
MSTSSGTSSHGFSARSGRLVNEASLGKS